MIKKFRLSMAAVAAVVLLSVGSVKAITLTDTDIYTGSTGLIDSTHSVSGQLSLDSNGYSLVPNSGSIKFTFSNNWLDRDAVDIVVNANLLGNGVIPQVFTFMGFGINIPVEFAVTAWSVAYGVSLDQSNPTGSIYLTKVEYSADVTANVDVKSVPDGGTTLSLLGLALTGLGLARRRFNS